MYSESEIEYIGLLPMQEALLENLYFLSTLLPHNRDEYGMIKEMVTFLTTNNIEARTCSRKSKKDNRSKKKANTEKKGNDHRRKLTVKNK